MKIKIIIIISGLLLPLTLFSQPIIKGKVIDSNKNLVPHAVVALLKNLNKSLVNTAIADSTGYFEINYVAGCHLYVSSIGYLSNITEIDLNQESVNIVLEPDAEMKLDAAVVQAKGHSIIQKSDRVVFVALSDLIKKDNSLELLKFAPLVSVNDIGISIMGKNSTQIYINGRKSRFGGSALIAYLKSLPADRIESVEIISAPGSSYKGEGDFGVLNINITDSEYDGLMGSVNLLIRKAHYFKETGTVSLNYQKNKLSTNLSIGAGNDNNYRDTEEQTFFKSAATKTSTIKNADRDYQTYWANMNLLYKLNAKQDLGFVASVSLNNEDTDEKGNTYYSSLDGSVDSIIRNANKWDNKVTQASFNANYIMRFTKNNSLAVDADYLYYSKQDKSVNDMDYVDSNNEFIDIYYKFKQDVPQVSSIWSAKIEYWQKFNDKHSLNLGADTYYSTIDNNDKVWTWENGGYIDDKNRTNHLKITESTAAIFLSFRSNWGQYFSTTVGVRPEYTYYKGKLRTTNTDFTNNYFRLLPSLSIGYNPSKNHALSYTLSNRITRPSFRSLNPFRIYTSPENSYYGNPYLKPSNNLYQSVNYTAYGKNMFSVSYGHTTDAVYSATIINGDNTIEATPTNYGKEQNIRISYNFYSSYWKGKAYISFNTSFTHSSYKGNAGGVAINNTGTRLDIGFRNMLTISEKHKLYFTLSAFFTPKTTYVQSTSPSQFAIDPELRKQFGSKWTLSLSHYGSFYHYDGKFNLKSKNTNDNEILKTIRFSKGETQVTKFSITYNFGNQKVKRLNERQTSNTNVKNRVL